MGIIIFKFIGCKCYHLGNFLCMNNAKRDINDSVIRVKIGPDLKYISISKIIERFAISINQIFTNRVSVGKAHKILDTKIKSLIKRWFSLLLLRDGYITTIDMTGIDITFLVDVTLVVTVVILYSLYGLTCYIFFISLLLFLLFPFASLVHLFFFFPFFPFFFGFCYSTDKYAFL